MSYTKRQIVNQAFSEIGLAVYEFDIQPDQIEDALIKLDAMLSEWSIKGIRLGYLSPVTIAESDVDLASGIPNYAYNAVVANLAISLAGSIGKQVSPHTLAMASNGLNTLMSISAKPKERRYPGMPSGAGNKNFEYPFMVEQENEEIERPETSVTFE